MTTRHLVDPEIVPVLEQFPTLRLTPETLPQVRALTVQMLDQQRDRARVPGDRGDGAARAWTARGRSRVVEVFPPAAGRGVC